MDRGARFSSCSECYVDRLDSLAFILHFLNLSWISSRSVCNLCEAMAGSLSMVTTADSSAKVAVVFKNLVYPLYDSMCHFCCGVPLPEAELMIGALICYFQPLGGAF
jgi:hypothetical protein